MIIRWNGAGASTLTSSTLWGSSWPRFVDDPRRSEVLKYFEDRFGIGLDVFQSFGLLESPQAYWLLSLSPQVEKLKRLRIHTAGIPVLRKMKQELKPTTTAIQIFGNRATKNIVNLNRQQAADLLKNEEMPFPSSMAPGYVILAYRRHFLGCGLYTGRRLLSQIPRSYLPGLRNKVQEIS